MRLDTGLGAITLIITTTEESFTTRVWMSVSLSAVLTQNANPSTIESREVITVLSPITPDTRWGAVIRALLVDMIDGTITKSKETEINNH